MVTNNDLESKAIFPEMKKKLKFSNHELNIEYKKNELSEIQLAYTLSIHKSQGSEYPVVIVPLLKQHFIMLQRNLLYTATTRAKQKLFLIGSLDAFSMAVKNNKTEIRRTNLVERLKLLEKRN